MEQTIKLKRSEFEAIYELYEAFVVDESATTPAEKLVLTLQFQVWLKLRKMNVNYKPKYKLKLTPAEAQAFLIYWGNYDFGNISFSANLLNTIKNTLHQNLSLITT